MGRCSIRCDSRPHVPIRFAEAFMVQHRQFPSQPTDDCRRSLQHGDAPGERLLAAGYEVRRVRYQRPGPVPDRGRGRHDGPGVRLPSQDFRVEQLVQLVPDVRVHPAVYDRVGHRGRHGGQMADGQRQVQLFGRQRLRHQVDGQREQGQREPAHREHHSDA